MKKNIIYGILALVSMVILGGCGGSFVAKNKDMGIAPGKKPVYGIMASNVYVNGKTSPELDKYITSEFAQYVNGNGGNVIALDPALFPSLGDAAKKYTETLNKNKVSEQSNFGVLREDLEKAGVDALILVNVGASCPSFASQLGQAAVQASVLALLGSGVIMTTPPATWFYSTVLSKQGNPMYYDRMLFGRIFRRNFGNMNERRKMYDYIHNDINDKLS